MPTPEELAAKYGGGPQKTGPLAGIDIDALAEKYSNAPDYETLPANIQKFPELATVPVRQPTPVESFQAGVGQGIRDIPQGVASGIGAVDEAMTEGGADRNRLFKKNLKTQQTGYENKYGDNGPASIGRTTGQVLATAPLAPNASVARAAGALPVTLATGSKVAAPFINRLTAATAKGAIGGGEFGALTAQTNDKSLARNVGEGIITGAIGGPIVEGAGALASKAVKGTEGLWANVNISRLAHSAGLDPAAVKNIVGRLEAAGLTPVEAQVALNKLGPKATLADLDASLTAELRGLSTKGGKATSVSEGRMTARAETDNADAVKIFESRFGPKPVLEAEKEAVYKQAQTLTGPDYKAAHASPQQLDISKPIADIDKALETAVGEKAAYLKKVKGYLFKDVKDPATGEITKVLKNDVKSLHEVRIELDSIISKAEDKTQNSAGKNALNAVKSVRAGIDEALKSNAQMAAADLKFSKAMEVKDAIDFGYNVIDKGKINKEEFKKAFDSLGGIDVAHKASLQEGVRKGMRAAVGDIMERKEQGELSAAIRLFEKKAVNRANFKHAFGSAGDDVLDDVHKAVTFRNTERQVKFGSDTARNEAIRDRYEGSRRSNGILGEAATGAVADTISGIPLAATTIMTVKKAGSNKLIKMSENRLDRLIEGSADILSRSGAERDVAVGIAERVKAIQDKTAKSTKSSVLRLPVAASSPIGEEAYEKGKNAVNKIRALSF